MKIAIFHNFIDNIGGAEIVTLTLARELNGSIYTTNINKENISKMGFADVLPRIHSIGKIPRNAPWRHQLALWKFGRIDLGKKYDFYIISGDWSISGAVKNKPNLWYAHSPLNELWAFRKYIRANMLRFWQRPLYDVWVFFNRKLTKKYIENIEKIVCNSKNTKERVLKYYNRKSEIIYPPVYINNYKWNGDKNYWLSVNRLIPHKRIEIQMQAFSELPNEKLIIVGSYERGASQFEKYKNKIQKIKPANANIINWVNHDELTKLYSECKGFIATARDEDFGMSIVEALASGKPVIASNEGGHKETVIDSRNGILIDDINSIKLLEAIKNISLELEKNPVKYKNTCKSDATRFSINEFINKIKSTILN